MKNNQAIQEFLKTTGLDNSLLVGYYGGGNFGDELLLEVLLNLLHTNQPEAQVDIYYLHPEWFSDFHKDFGHRVVNAQSLSDSFKSFMRSKQVIVGGGGLWGLDFNIKVLFLSVMLFIGRFIFRKDVYLLGVGFYNSTSYLGRIGAWFAGKAANSILARDEESYENFLSVNKKTKLAADFSIYLDEISESNYKSEIERINKILSIQKKTLFLSVRNFKPPLDSHYRHLVEQIITANFDKNIILIILEPRKINPSAFAFLLRQSKKNHPHIKTFDFGVNPVAFYFFTRIHSEKLLFITPHYHAIAIAIKNKIPFLPIVYDNKTVQLLKDNGVKDFIWVKDLINAKAQIFLNSEFNA